MDWKPYKRYPTPERKRRPHQEVGGAISQYKQPHTSWVGNPTERKLTGSQRLTYRSESSEPHIKLSRVGIWHREKEPLEHLALKASGAHVQKLHKMGETGTPFLKGAHRLSRALSPRAKQRLHRNLGQTCLWMLEDLLGNLGQLWLVVGEEHWRQRSQE